MSCEVLDALRICALSEVRRNALICDSIPFSSTSLEFARVFSHDTQISMQHFCKATGMMERDSKDDLANRNDSFQSQSIDG